MYFAGNRLLRMIPCWGSRTLSLLRISPASRPRRSTAAWGSSPKTAAGWRPVDRCCTASCELADVDREPAGLRLMAARQRLSVRIGQRYRPTPGGKGVLSRPAVPLEVTRAADLLL